MYGPSFLVYERSQGRFLEFFCGNKSARNEAKNVYPYLPSDAGRHRRQGGAGRGREQFVVARADSPDAHEPAGREGHVLLARSGRRQEHGEVPQAAGAGAGRQGDDRFRVREGQRRRACARAARRSRPLVLICSRLDLPSQAPAGLSTRCTPPGVRGRLRIGSASGDVHHGRVYAFRRARKARRNALPIFVEVAAQMNPECLLIAAPSINFDALHKCV